MYILNETSLKVYNKLPKAVQKQISQNQAELEKICCIEYGLKHTDITSGYRSVVYNNTLPGSKTDSNHIYGAALDFSRNIDYKPLLGDKRINVIIEKKCIHVEAT